MTVNGIEHIEYLPVMDFKNKSIPSDNITSFDVNKAIQRSLTKACARHGLGLYIYAGEDLPEEETTSYERPVADKVYFCEQCSKPITPTTKKDGSIMTVDEIRDYTRKHYGHELCTVCATKANRAAKAYAEREDGT